MAGRNLRRVLFRLHALVGLNLSLLFALSFVTGTLLLFSPELTLAGRPDLWLARLTPPEQTTFGAAYDNIRKADPGTEIFIMRRSERPWFGDIAYVKDARDRPRMVWTDPADGRVLGSGGAGLAAARNAIREIHVNYLTRWRPAEVAVTALSVALFSMLVTGLVTYRRFWRGMLRRPAAGGDARLRMGAWHRLVAVWVWPFLLIVSVSGMIFLLDRIGVRPRHPPPGALAVRAERLPAGFDGHDLDRLVAAAEAVVPELVATQITLPGLPREPLAVVGHIAGRGAMFGPAEVRFDPATMGIVARDLPETGNAMARILPVAIGVHYGKWGGFVSILVWVAFGLGAVTLAVTGMRVFIARLRPARNDRSAGGLDVFLGGLGPVKWAYAALAVTMAAMALIHAI
ncbi:PepSY domain-containing protein [Defluviimonas sp. WL0024]|uniref:PepSY domain-containing protein n=2 Tax=Albidovulum TaxID=205889 RepID=A0ABT3J3Z3_9RHOB|nr:MULTISPECIES: PepSY-associated TM helix domain-containing protein [Defluviimonas]MCU9847899.1 PepSY domain-containing protein [Defluviimonas sp. WL0024]MCW3782388.1 PepSY domain-containing protein [Defluviimonas salinarum]